MYYFFPLCTTLYYFFLHFCTTFKKAVLAALSSEAQLDGSSNLILTIQQFGNSQVKPRQFWGLIGIEILWFQKTKKKLLG